MLNATAILVGVVLVIWEAAQRFQSPVEVPGLTVLLVALVGIGVNTGSALLFKKSQKHDLNAKGAFLHMAADAAVSGAVVLAAAGILFSGWQWLDPTVAIAVSLLIAWTAWGLMRDAVRLELDGVPEAIDRQAVATFIGEQPGVSNVHDLHIWALSTTRTALAAHVVWDGIDTDAFLDRVTDKLEHDFAITHVTLQLERAPCERAGACLES
jgi:cobalt-zinc-cadmium efflux system protein